jgi:nitroreductase
MNEPRFLPLSICEEPPPAVMQERVAAFEANLQRRRTVRQFSDRPVPRSIIEQCLPSAGTAPSGAHQQPWHFVAISNPAVKARIREAAEREEYDFYHHGIPPPTACKAAPHRRGAPARDAKVPDIVRKPLADIATFLSG